MDFEAHGLPVGEVAAIMNEVNSIHKDYAKSMRNDKAIEHNKLGKHMMHLMRLYMIKDPYANSEPTKSSGVSIQY